MRNIKIEIEYDGSNYSGWQVQENSVTVQGQIIGALEELTGRHIRIHGSGRTDAGVHARGQVASFILESSIPTERLPLALNSILPRDIAITRAEEVPMDFHARFSAIGKRYIYHIYQSQFRSPILRNYSYHVHHKLDYHTIREAAEIFIGSHDFRAFMASGSSVKNTVRTINKLDISKEGKSLYICIEGDGFLYNMVRIIVGTLVDVARGKIEIGQIERALESKDRTMAGHTAPAQGLFLDKVFYPLTH